MTCRHCEKPIVKRLNRRRIYCSVQCRNAYRDLGKGTKR